MSASGMENKYLGLSETPDLQVARTSGSYLYDTKGKRYIDFVMGWCVGNFGWGNPELRRRAKNFRGPDYVYPEYSYKPWGELARLLVSIAPGNLQKCFRATGGSEAVEIALQAAMLHTGRGKFLSLEGSYHGNTIATMSIADSENREKFENMLANCHKIEPPLDSRALQKIETQLKRRDVAAFIMEPISINLGVLIPDGAFMTELQRLCRKYGTLLVVDEVACGFGRTGALFASEHYDIEPDIMCIAKAITGGVGGMGATLTTSEVADSLEEDGNFYSTYGWHPRSTDIGIATVRYIQRNKRGLLSHVAEISEYFRERLSEMEFDEPPGIHIQGLAIGVDVKDEDYASEIEDGCRRRGLLLTTEGSSLLLLPALNIDRSVARRGLDILETAI
jgi:adenosylmethionine-8-amino-7-oxononanoate aminotransferase